MRARLEAGLRRLWSRDIGPVGRGISVALLPAELLFRSSVAVRGRAYDLGVFRPVDVPVPVVSIGNLVVGGTGKTPVAAWLVGELASLDMRPALLSRGYGEDEVLLHRRWHPEVPVRVDPDRVAAARHEVASGARSLVLDDGFQHRRLGRDLDVVLVAAEHPFPGPLLPRGPYREPASALRRADAVVVTRKVASDETVRRRMESVGALAPGAAVVQVDLVPGTWRSLGGEPVDEGPGDDLLAVTSIAAPSTFTGLVEQLGLEPPELLAFPDHHVYDASDVERIVRAAGPRTVVTTEKDAVKLEPFRGTLPRVRVLPLNVEPGKGGEVLLDRLRRLSGREGVA